MNETPSSTRSAPNAAASSTSPSGPARNTGSRANPSNPARNSPPAKKTASLRAGHWLAVWFGCGLSPVAPGTAGSLAALAIGWLAFRYAGFSPWHFAVLAIPFAAAGVWAAGCEERWSGKTDPGSCVVDEVAGQWIALAGATVLSWPAWVIAFALFRTFDIWKPVPIKRLQDLPGGWGVMADDVLAGVYAALVLYAAGCFNLY